MVDCSLCRLVAAKKRNFQVYEDEATIAMHAVQPQARGHVIVFPKRHVAHLEAMPGPEALALWRTVQTVHTAFVEGNRAQGTSIIVNNGRLAGQTPPHVCVHLMMRREEDGGRPATIAVPKKPLVTDVEIIDCIRNTRLALDKMAGTHVEQLRPGRSTASQT